MQNNNRQYVHANLTLEYFNGVSGRITETGRVFIRKEHDDVYDEVEVGASLIYKIAKAGRLTEFSKSDVIFDHTRGIRVVVSKKNNMVKIVKPEGEALDEVTVPMAFILKIKDALMVTRQVIIKSEVKENG